QVDERDGFRVSNLRARLAIITIPTALHLPAANQSVIAVPAEMLRSNTGIGRDYHPILGPYALDGGHSAFVYERSESLREESIRSLENALKRRHQNWAWDGGERIGPTLSNN